MDPMYNFKKATKLYIVENGNKHIIDIYPDISASQTFDEQSYRRKTLHALNDLHDGATIGKASPANFSFTTPIVDTAVTPIVLTLGTNYANGTVSSFDIYFETDNLLYKIEKCVIATTTFNLSPQEIITASISGSATKLMPFTGTIPGTAVTVASKDYTKIERATISIAGTILASVAAVNIEFSNSIRWLETGTIQSAVSGELDYPSQYVVEGRTVSGSVTEFLTSDNKSLLTDTSTSAAVDIIVGTRTTSNLLRFSLPSTVFTRRFNFEDLITRVYDYRLNTNTTIVKPIYKGV